MGVHATGNFKPVQWYNQPCNQQGMFVACETSAVCFQIYINGPRRDANNSGICRYFKLYILPYNFSTAPKVSGKSRTRATRYFITFVFTVSTFSMQLVHVDGDFDDAGQMCQNMGATLATVKTDGQNAGIFGTF